MTTDQQKYLTYLIMLKEFKSDYKRYVLGFEHKNEMDWKSYEKWKDEVTESFPVDGIQVGKYKAVIHAKSLEPDFNSRNQVFYIAKKKQIVLHTHLKGESK